MGFFVTESLVKDRKNYEMEHVSIEDIFPEACEAHGYRLVGLANRRARDEATDRVTTLGEVHANTIALLANPEILEQLKAELSDMPADYDPWAYAVNKSRALRAKELK